MFLRIFDNLISCSKTSLLHSHDIFGFPVKSSLPPIVRQAPCYNFLIEFKTKLLCSGNTLTSSDFFTIHASVTITIALIATCGRCLSLGLALSHGGFNVINPVAWTNFENGIIISDGFLETSATFLLLALECLFAEKIIHFES